MLKIRLTRRGKKNRAFFRLVLAEHTAPVKGRFLEALGYFNPHTKEKNLKADRIKYWLEKGAHCSDTVHNLLVREGIVKGPKRALKMRKKADEVKKADIAENKSEEKVDKKGEVEEEKTGEKPKKEIKGSKAEEKTEEVKKDE